MGKGLIIAGIVALGLLLLGGSCTAKYIGFRQEAVSHENTIDADDKDILNVDTVLTNNLKTQGLPIAEYKDLIKESFKMANESRYGKSGSQAAMQWIKEQNPQIDSSIFKKLQTVVEIGYAKFESAQRSKIEHGRAYKSFIEREQQIPIWGSIVTAGFPRKPWDQLLQIYISGETKEMKETGIQKAKTLR